jgi:AraC-like DNA-binding protein
MAERAGVSEATVRRIWRAHGLKPHLSRTFKVSTDPQFAEKLTDIVAQHIFDAKGAVRVADLAQSFGCGLRQFERCFRREVGVSPKAYARVSRFQAAVDTKLSKPHRRWVDIAHDLGYHDQMHLVHDFRQLVGGTPSVLLSVIGDARPHTLGETNLLP